MDFTNKTLLPMPKTLLGLYWKMLKSFPLYFIFQTLLSTSLTAWGIINGPLVTKYIYSIFDNGVIIPDFWANATHAIIIAAILISVGTPFYILSSVVSNRMRPRIRQWATAELYEYVYSHDYKFFLDRNIGSIQSFVNKIYDGFIPLTMDLFIQVVGITIGLGLASVMLGDLDILVLIVVIGNGVVNLAWSLLNMRKSARLNATISKLGSKLAGTVSDSILNFMNIKIFASRKYEREYIDRERDESLTANWNFSRFRISKDYIINIFNDIVYIGLIILCAKLFFDGRILVSGFAFILSVFNRFGQKFRDLGRIIKDSGDNYSDARQAFTEVMVVQTVTDRPRAKPLTVPHGEIDLRDISFKYNDDWVVRDMSLKIKPGERVGIVGLSGAGKTTLSHLLLRLFDVQRGGIYIDGQNIKNITQDSLRNQISFVPQDPVLFNRTLAENIGYARPTATTEEIEHAAKLANIHDFIVSTKDGYGTIVGNRGIKLSGGQRQRIAIARVILKNAPILILDEATSSLDSATEQSIQKSFGTLMRGRTTIVIAHRLSTLRKMSRIVVMEQGAIAESGTHAALLKKNGIYARLWKMQSGGFIKE
ncbi:MAG: ABC transporter ATP-binding protein/permease [Proteobacteria bacterium]|nr:ABC transporter ATP-binding protein/permease [Pseudomonadota bacterium]